MKLPVSMLLFLIACGSSGSMPGGGNGPADAPASTTDGPSGPTITIQGTAFDVSTGTPQPLTGVTIGAYSNADVAHPVVTTTTGTGGTYMMAVPTSGGVLDGFIKATLTSYTDTYLYAPAPITMNFNGADANMITSQIFGILGGAIHQSATNGIVVLEVEDATGKLVTGAMVSATSGVPAASVGTVLYTDPKGGLFPVAGTGTLADGRAYLINLPTAAPVTVSAGSSFKSHDVTARANVLTTTLITP